MRQNWNTEAEKASLWFKWGSLEAWEGLGLESIDVRLASEDLLVVRFSPKEKNEQRLKKVFLLQLGSGGQPVVRSCVCCLGRNPSMRSLSGGGSREGYTVCPIPQSLHNSHEYSTFRQQTFLHQFSCLYSSSLVKFATHTSIQMVPSNVHNCTVLLFCASKYAEETLPVAKWTHREISTWQTKLKVGNQIRFAFGNVSDF